MSELLAFHSHSVNRRKPLSLFSDCRRYRYLLSWPTGLQNERILGCCAANPSKAGQLNPDGTFMSDPTVSRMVNLARAMGFGWFCMVNARAYVSTDPKGVPPGPEGIGPFNDIWVKTVARDSHLMLLAYGHLGADRGPRIIEIVRAAGKVPHALALTKDGIPRHPRGVPGSARPFPIGGI